MHLAQFRKCCCRCMMYRYVSLSLSLVLGVWCNAAPSWMGTVPPPPLFGARLKRSCSREKRAEQGSQGGKCKQGKKSEARKRRKKEALEATSLLNERTAGSWRLTPSCSFTWRFKRDFSLSASVDLSEICVRKETKWHL